METDFNRLEEDLNHLSREAERFARDIISPGQMQDYMYALRSNIIKHGQMLRKARDSRCRDTQRSQAERIMRLIAADLHTLMRIEEGYQSRRAA